MSQQRISTGVAGLDVILGGGLPPNRTYLVQGSAGTGKTTLGLQFLLQGVRSAEPGLYVTLSETDAELRAVAESHGWSLEGVSICDLQTQEQDLRTDAQYTLFHPSEVELSSTTKSVLGYVDQIRPRRVVFDSLSDMRLLARDSLRYRRQILALKHYFAARGCTVLLLDTQPQGERDFDLDTIAHGVIYLEQHNPDYGPKRRRITVQKMRGVAFKDGTHDFAVRTGGLTVFPRLEADTRAAAPIQPFVSGVAALDDLLGGGVHYGTSTLLLGPSGVGKSSVATALIVSAAQRHPASVFLFDETLSSWRMRAAGLGIDVDGAMKSGRLQVLEVNPATLTPGEFAVYVRDEVNNRGVRAVAIDSLNGYLNATPHEQFLNLHLHELLMFLDKAAVASFLVLAQHGVLGDGVVSAVDLSYIADTVILLRYFEAFGAVHHAVSVVKKRIGPHQKSIRELVLSDNGVSIGRELVDFNGVLTGRPVYTGTRNALSSEASAGARSDPK